MIAHAEGFDPLKKCECDNTPPVKFYLRDEETGEWECVGAIVGPITISYDPPPEGCILDERR